jgi:hypothetical protein
VTAGAYGGKTIPYVSGPGFLENDLAVYKTFTIHDEHKVQFRVSAFNWLNHALPVFSGASGPTNMYYQVNYQTKAIAANTASAGTGPAPGGTGTGLPYASTFGVLDYKSAAPSQRIMEFDIKYSF